MTRSRVEDDSVTTIELDRRSRVDESEHDGPLWRRLVSFAITAAIIALTIYLWPSMLGGQTRLVIVTGHSMEPTYDLRDIVVARDAGHTEVGDIVVFEVPEGKAEGMLIIHRVLKIDDEGFFITQGDNRTTPDQWQLTEENIVGQPLVHIPKGGKALGFIQNIWVIALLVGLVALFLLWPDEDEAEDEAEEEEEEEEQLVEVEATITPEMEAAARWRALDDTRALDRDEAWKVVRQPAIIEEVVVPEMPATSVEVFADSDSPGEMSPDALAELWLESELQKVIDDDVMAEAMAWLDQQLEGVDQPVAH